ncbi:MAG: hypothetical protein ABSD92_04570 [Candidatus Bathyarchaeia archaeon]
MSRNERLKKFEAVVLEAVDEAFSTLGETAKTSIYFHLEHKFFIQEKDIPYMIDDFSYALERVFGMAAKHLEILIMKKLHEKITCSYKWEGPSWLVPELTFRQYVELVRLQYEEKEKTENVEVWVNAEENQKLHV